MFRSPSVSAKVKVKQLSEAQGVHSDHLAAIKRVTRFHVGVMLYWGFIDFAGAISGRCWNLISDQDIGETKRMLSEEYIMASIDLQFIYLCKGQSNCSPTGNWTERLPGFDLLIYQQTLKYSFTFV